MDPAIGRIDDCVGFDTYHESDQACAAADFCREIPPGRVVLAAVADEAGLALPIWNVGTHSCDLPNTNSCVTRAIGCLKGLGSERIDLVPYWGTWAMISVKGGDRLAEDSHAPRYATPVTGFCRLSAYVTTSITTGLTMQVLPGPTAATPTPFLTATAVAPAPPHRPRCTLHSAPVSLAAYTQPGAGATSTTPVSGATR